MIFVPAASAPHKIDRSAAASQIRLEMVRKAIEDEPRFAVDDCELRRDPPSYTIDTVEIIQRREEDAQFFYCIGQDNVSSLTSWHRFTELKKIVQFVVLDR